MEQETPSILVRPAREDEQKSLEALQLRASLMNEGDRAFLLANPDVINLPLQQIQDGLVFVAELTGTVVGYVSLRV
jgi:hypothetical protein